MFDSHPVSSHLERNNRRSKRNHNHDPQSPDRHLKFPLDISSQQSHSLYLKLYQQLYGFQCRPQVEAQSYCQNNSVIIVVQPICILLVSVQSATSMTDFAISGNICVFLRSSLVGIQSFFLKPLFWFPY